MTPSPHRLTLDPLSDTTWRLCDSSFAACDADSIVAYIELRPDDRYEVTWIARGIGVATFGSLSDVLDSASAVLHTPAREPARKPIPIAHRPPLSAV
ncbi:MAG: hypothetical protein P0Y48_13120 [Candidatus Microbacterium phytovorans]|uniref:Uncharacterized protein n=1 Tax=Candidatus Microbacterium phytovorans TaxID=3121374 RepID=A0AAJ6B2Y2_9MICO|nr:hypothetical protein [Microbacterium sp.]WEK13385.1 MAG: hypothetical protein P0Y48_13120 [Microbacterium sp.]